LTLVRFVSFPVVKTGGYLQVTPMELTLVRFVSFPVVKNQRLFIGYYMALIADKTL